MKIYFSISGGPGRGAGACQRRSTGRKADKYNKQADQYNRQADQYNQQEDQYNQQTDQYNLNTMFITLRTRATERIPLRTGVLNLAHEILHRWLGRGGREGLKKICKIEI
jgi:hypothetical protein